MTSSPRHLPTRGPLALALAGILGLGACSLEFSGQPTEYKLSGETMEILAVDGEAQIALTEQLTRLFGTQAEPHLQADPGSLSIGRELYESRCLHCHGNEGGGDGITSRSVVPVPRDFRYGIFKYNNIADGGRPELSDLERIVRVGVNGTAMPAMTDLDESKIRELARYTRYLSVRGEVETWIAEEYEPGDPITEDMAQEAYDEVVEKWFHAERRRVVAPSEVPESTEASIRLGAELFHDPLGANCAGCHGIGGGERGPAAWNTTPLSPDNKVALLRDAWGHDSIPRLLDSEIYRHGTDPRTLYERFYLGIDGTPMAGIGETLDAEGNRQFSEEDLWALVHYVSALKSGSEADLTGALEDQYRTTK